MSEESLQLLPPANLSSPTNKSFELKTPPHSTLRSSNIKRIDDSSNSILHSEKHGLLSPEFSSPQLRYDSDIISRNNNNNNNNNNQNDDNNNKKKKNSSSSSSTNLNDSPTHDSSSDKENNLNPQIQLPLPAPDFSNKKRSFPSSNIDITAKRSRKFKGPVDCVIPEPHEMPLIVFESNLKPPYSYASLIGMALLRSPERRLTLAEIYQWISDNFKYYKKGEVGWQNSIRHNLSLNKSFEKAEKSKDRKGHFWQIVSGYEYIFCNIKESKRNINSANAVKKSKSLKSQNQNGSNESLLLSTPVSNKSHDDYDDDDSNNNHNINSMKSNNYNYNNDDDKFDSISKKTDFKNQTPINTTTLGSIPELNIQYSSYGTNLGSLNSSPMIFYHDSPIDNSINSKNIDFTSSFSCKSNFELSPIRMNETGPLLEPITPNISNSLLKISLPPIQKQLLSLQQFPTSLSTPTSASKLQQSQQQQLLQQQHPQHLQIPISSDIHSSKFRTPSRIMNSPLVNACSSSIMKKLWTSPSYLDDFYTSPIASNKDNSNNLNSVMYPNGNGIDNVTELFGNRSLGSPLPPLKKKVLLKNTTNNNLTNGYSTNQIFGIDICTINLQDDDHYK